MNIWAMTSGEAGLRNQALAVAEAVGGAITEKTVVLRRPWSLLPGSMCPDPIGKLDREFDVPRPPWPDLLVTCGRRSTAVSIAVRRLSGGRTRTVHLHNPQCGFHHFDLVLALAHDQLQARNVFLLNATPHRITPARLWDAADRWTELFATIPQPRLGVLIGGTIHGRGYDRDRVERLIGDLTQLIDLGCGLLITPSRRTERAVTNAIRDRLGHNPSAYVWDQTSENPYFGILALADALLVTADSASMISEAIGTGRPVATVSLSPTTRRLKLFIQALGTKGLVQPFAGVMPAPKHADHRVVDGAADAAKAIGDFLRIEPNHGSNAKGTAACQRN